ncbi:hypothetical protein PQ455_07275 [Sphingomonas naphthae]|uniref:Uncharacterized protein n=1 Tax=Sphingomonas naphthae TaxID=1813468 RepID=A0ABY7TT16_9SPHN|nr:hypothetical protein [Sphingomonas naphthae]WCT75009.1 hypothetical protein PQ455_07275 [Sphingomonas naphthae]
MSKRRLDVPHWHSDTLHRLHNPFDQVPDSVLHSYELEIRAMIRACERERARLATVQSLVTEAVRNRKPAKLVITDHAIVRFLERFRGWNMAEVEDEIQAMAEAHSPEVAVREGVVITVLPAGQEARVDEGEKG